MADRISLSKDWYKRGEQLLEEYELKEEPRVLFESYIYLWIALTVAAKEYCACDGKSFKNFNGERSTDKEEILHWALQFQGNIIKMLKENIDLVLDLCERKGVMSGQPIMDTESEETVNYHEQFIRYWESNTENSNRKQIVKTFILILNRVRNNLFHGAKSFRIESDIEILEMTTPLLKEITQLCVHTF
jgi:hypothetical protein